LFFYSAAGNASLLSAGKPFTQHLAYSGDGGKTIVKYGEIVPHIIEANRDPKVVWVEELSAYVMTLYFTENENGSTYGLLISKDLLHWAELQRLNLTQKSACADLYPLVCEETGERMWIFINAADEYYVGKMTADGFKPVQESLSLRHTQRSYAAQTFAGVEGRTLRIAWSNLVGPDTIFNGIMTFPNEMHLAKINGIYRLAAKPAKELSLLRKDTLSAAVADGQTTPIQMALTGDAYEINISWAKNTPAFTLTIYGQDICIYPAENRMELAGCEMPLSYSEDTNNAGFLVDTLGIEVFNDNGRIYSTVSCCPDFENRILELKPVSEGSQPEISVTISPLEWIW